MFDPARTEMKEPMAVKGICAMTSACRADDGAARHLPQKVRVNSSRKAARSTAPPFPTKLPIPSSDLPLRVFEIKHAGGAFRETTSRERSQLLSESWNVCKGHPQAAAREICKRESDNRITFCFFIAPCVLQGSTSFQIHGSRVRGSNSGSE